MFTAFLWVYADAGAAASFSDFEPAARYISLRAADRTVC
jgi:hypothetical protein